MLDFNICIQLISRSIKYIDTVNKLIVIGLDGASYNLIKKWRKDLPFLNSLMNKGSWGILKSTMPPITLPAWACIATGRTPRSLNIYDFQKIDFKRKKISIVNYHDWSPAFWNILEDLNYKVNVINYPATYPPIIKNGFMVSGFLSPENSKIYYPRYIENIFKKNNFRFKLYPEKNIYINNDEEYIKNVIDIFKERCKIIKYMLKNSDWDIFISVFMILDWIQHYYWHYHDETHILYNKDNPNRNLIFNIYEKIDNYLHEILNSYLENTNILILSDHGFGKLSGNFYINNWLEKEGYLIKSIPDNNIYSKILSRMINNKIYLKFFEKFTTIGNRIKYRYLINKILGDKTILDDPFSSNIFNMKICKDKTKAFGYGYYNALYINTIDRGGCIKKEQYKILLKNIINKLTDYGNENGLYFKFHANEYNINSPDLIYLINEGEYVQKNALIGKNIWEISSIKTGDHRIEGIWIFSGPDIKIKDDYPTEVINIAPTICKIYKVNKDIRFDGSVINDIIKENHER